MHFPAHPKDQFNLPPQNKADVQFFNPAGTSWQTWTKPKWASCCFMIAVSGGAGGGGGQNNNGGSAGGGGGAGSISRLISPAFFLPDQLYVQVGFGGRGGAADTAGATGNLSYISLGHSTALPNVILASGATAPGAGVNGSGGRTGGAGGTAATATTFTSFGHFASTGVNVANVGAGSTGGNAGSGTSLTVWNQTTAANNFILSGGAGGGSNPGGAGGAQNNGANALDLSFLGLVAAAGAIVTGGVTATVGGAGNPGLTRLQPFLQTGGSGGAYSSAAVGGRGGDGGYGCGGGGGGSGGAGQNGGGGGNGGPGLVLIISW